MGTRNRHKQSPVLPFGSCTRRELNKSIRDASEYAANHMGNSSPMGEDLPRDSRISAFNKRYGVQRGAPDAQTQAEKDREWYRQFGKKMA